MKDTNHTILCVLIGLCLLFLTYKVAVYLSAPPIRIIRIPDPNYIQGVCEAQERLKSQGLYDGRIDGIWGKETDKAYCDYMAIQCFKGD